MLQGSQLSKGQILISEWMTSDRCELADKFFLFFHTVSLKMSIESCLSAICIINLLVSTYILVFVVCLAHTDTWEREKKRELSQIFEKAEENVYRLEIGEYYCCFRYDNVNSALYEDFFTFRGNMLDMQGWSVIMMSTTYFSLI